MNVFNPQVLLSLAVPLAVATSAAVLWLRRRSQPRKKDAPKPAVLGMRHAPNGDIEWEPAPPGSHPMPIFFGDIADVADFSLFPGGTDVPPADFSLLPAQEAPPSPLFTDAVERLERLDIRGARAVLAVAVKRAHDRHDDVNEARALELLSKVEFDAGDYGDAVAHQTKLMRLVPRIGWHGRLTEFAQDHERYSRFCDGAQAVLRLDAEAGRWRYEDWQRALALTHEALEHAQEHLRPDHWLVARVLNTRGCIFYERGDSVEARNIWQRAEEILGEWPDRAPETLQAVRSNLRRCRRRLGF